MKAVFLSALFAAALLAGPGQAEEFKPSRTVEIVVNTGPGGGGDAFARAALLALGKDKLLPVNFVVLNRPGGGSINAINYLKEKAGDSHTIALFQSDWVTQGLVEEMATTTINELTPVAGMVIEPSLMVVRADSPYHSLGDFIEAAKAKPGQLKQSGGIPTSRDAMMRLVLMNNTKANWAFVTFPTGGERLSAVLGGHVDMMMIEPSEAGEIIRAGRLRAIAQINHRRLPNFPDVPTIKEAGYDVAIVTQPRGVVGPPNMPPEAVAYYSNLIKSWSESPAYQAYLNKMQIENAYLDSAGLKTFLADYANNLRGILKGEGIKVVR